MYTSSNGWWQSSYETLVEVSGMAYGGTHQVIYQIRDGGVQRRDGKVEMITTSYGGGSSFSSENRAGLGVSNSSISNGAMDSYVPNARSRAFRRRS
jgi:hypothetical protein